MRKNLKMSGGLHIKYSQILKKVFQNVFSVQKRVLWSIDRPQSIPGHWTTCTSWQVASTITENECQKTCFYDPQIAHVASPAIDLVYFLASSLSDHVHEHYQDLLLRASTTGSSRRPWELFGLQVTSGVGGGNSCKWITGIINFFPHTQINFFPHTSYTVFTVFLTNKYLINKQIKQTDSSLWKKKSFSAQDLCFMIFSANNLCPLCTC